MAISELKAVSAKSAWDQAVAWKASAPPQLLARFIEKATDGKVKGDQLLQLLAEYFRLGIAPETHFIVGNLRGKDEKAKLVITITLNAMLVLAERDPNFGSIQDGEVEFESDGLAPKWATAYVRRKDIAEPFVARLLYREYVGKDFNGKVSGVWRDKPVSMLCKCAKAAALRLAYPTALAGIFIPEELEREAVDAVDMIRDTFARHEHAGAVVNTGTGEVIKRAEAVPSAQSEKPPVETPKDSDPVQTPAEAAKPAPSPKDAPETAPAKPAVPLVFRGIDSQDMRGPLIRKAYELMGVPIAKQSHEQHLAVIRQVSHAIGRPDGAVPTEWADFELAELRKYVDYRTKAQSAIAADSVKSAEEPPKTESRSKTQSRRDPHAMTAVMAQMIERDTEIYGLDEHTIANMCKDISNGALSDWREFSREQAAHLLDTIRAFAESRGLQNNRRTG